ncbi:MAG: hypothetical protein AAGG48_13305 [Planctomycetota bacterium]
MLFLSQLAHSNDWNQFGGPNANFRLAPTTSLESRPIQPRRVWQRSLGAGLSPVTVADELILVCHLDADDPLRETVTALDRGTGETIWSHSYDIKKLEKQEAFGGRNRSPQATPVIFQDRVITLGFTGWVHALERAT